MASNGGDASSIIQEIERLKAEKIEIDTRISFLQTQLNEIVPNGTTDLSSSSSTHPPFRYARHGLTPDMIHRYSRHLLLPSFGVEGQSIILFIYFDLMIEVEFTSFSLM